MIRNIPVSKLKIKPLDENQDVIEGDSFEALINPTGYSMNYNVCTNVDQAAGTQGASIRYNKLLPKTLTFSFLFDSTGSLGVETLNPKGIQPEIDRFLNMAYGVDPATRESNNLQVQWGQLIFNCKLGNVSIAYSMFDFNGNPCRGTAACTFNGIITPKQLAEDCAGSSKGTKVKEVAEGDSLDAIAQKETKQSSKCGVGAAAALSVAVLGIAAANKLKSTRGPIGLPPALKLIIPPKVN